jgi:hypothetical protein
MLTSVEHFAGREIVVTEKRDGENTTVYCDGTHARSLDSGHHESRAWLKALWAQIRHDIPEGYRVCGENLYAQHSIGYQNLSTYFEVFSVWDGSRCLAWDETVEWCGLLGLTPVPVLYRGVWDEAAVKRCFRQQGCAGDPQEGYVVRIAGSFDYQDFGTSLAKWVRANHVQTDTHWTHQTVVPNGLVV